MGELLPLFDDQARERLTSSLFPQDAVVNDLIPGGEQLERMVTFSHDRWELAGHSSWTTKVGGKTHIGFEQVPERFRDLAKDLALFQINPSLADGVARRPTKPMAQSWARSQEPVKLVTAQGNIKLLAHALRVITTHGIDTFDSDGWERVRALLIQPVHVSEKAEQLSPLTGRGRAQQLIALWEVQQCGDHGNILGEGRPFDGKETTELYGTRSRQNSVRPHEHVGDALGFAAWCIDHVMEDVVARVEWWAEQGRRADPPLSPEGQKEAMYDLCARFAYDHDGFLPGVMNRNGELTVALSVMGRMIGLYGPESYAVGRYARDKLKDTTEPSWTVDPCPLPLSSVVNREGQAVSWAPRLLPTDDALDLWQRRVIYLSMIYLQCTLMLRDQQLTELPLDCLTSEEVTRPNGAVFTEYRLRAYRTKNRAAPVPTTVVCNGRVARVVMLLQRLHVTLDIDARRSELTGERLLFDQRLATPWGKKPRVDARESLHLDLAFVQVIRRAARDLYDRGVIPRHLDHLTVTPAQIRITTAQAYASREHGQALAAAFGQWDSKAVMQGYVGDVFRIISPIDPDEVVAEAQMDAGRHLVRAARNRGTMTGAGGKRLDATLERANLVANPGPLSPSRLRVLGKKNPHVTQGPLSLCIYQPEGAMCGGQGSPDWRHCAPGVCRNSVMSLLDRARYELQRRLYAGMASPVMIREASKLDDANPAIRREFSALSDGELKDLIREELDDYITEALNK